LKGDNGNDTLSGCIEEPVTSKRLAPGRLSQKAVIVERRKIGR